MKSVKEIELGWLDALKVYYPEREIKTMFLFCLEDLFGLTKSTLLVNPLLELGMDAQIQLQSVCERLATGEPYQYIVGFTYFDELKIAVNPSVLIPRPETEELVYWISKTLPSGFSESILDWCTGSGCIALALKKRFPSAVIYATDLSDQAVHTAALNAKELKLDILLQEDDALHPLFDRKVHLIVSNPPYIPFQEQKEMHENVVNFEPEMALFVPDNDPLLFYKAIASYAFDHLEPNGQLFFELHEDFAIATKKMVMNLGFSDVEIRQDLQGKWRMLRAVKNVNIG